MAEKKEGAKAKKKLPKGRHLSALKRERQNNKLNARNRSNRSALRTAVKVARTELSAESVQKSRQRARQSCQQGHHSKTPCCSLDFAFAHSREQSCVIF